MTVITIEGVYMGANVKSSTFDGVTKTALYVDVYQPTSTSNEKMVQLKTEDVALYSKLADEYDMGSVFKVSASVSAYKNKAYFKLIDIIAS